MSVVGERAVTAAEAAAPLAEDVATRAPTPEPPNTRPILATVDAARVPRWRSELAAALLVMIGLTAVFFHGVVFLGRTILPLHTAGVMGLGPPYGYAGQIRPDPYRLDPGASAWVIEPASHKAGREYAAGRLPLWNEHQGFGTPLLASAQAGALDLTRLPVLLVRDPLAWDFYYLYRIALGGLAAFAFGRLVGLHPWAAIVTAAAFVFSGHFFTFSNNTHVTTYLLMPLILLGAELVARRRLRAGFVVAALAIAATILVGHPEATLLALLFGAGYGAFRLGVLGCERPGLRAWAARAAALLAAGVVGVLLAAPFLVALAEFVPQAHHVHGEGRALGLSFLPPSQAITLVAPYFLGRPLDPPVPGVTKGAVLSWVGASVVVLAIIGALPSRATVYRRAGLFAIVAGAIVLGKIHGARAVNWLGYLPGLNITYFYVFGAPLAAFCLALLAGLGVHRLLAREIRPAWGALGLALVAAIIYRGVYANITDPGVVTFDHVARTAGVALLFALLCGAAIVAARWVHPGVAAAACGVLVLAELFAYAPTDALADRHDPLTRPPFVQFLQERPGAEPFRVFATDGLLFPNRAGEFGLHDVRSVEALQVDRYIAYVRNFVAAGINDRFMGGPYTSPEQPARIAGNPWFDLTGARYVIRAGENAALPGEGGLIDAVLAANPGAVNPPFVTRDQFAIGGVTKPVLFQHPPSSLRYSMVVTAQRSALRFSLGLNPVVWDPSRGDGVAFEVSVEADGARERLFRRELDPKRDPAARAWIDDSVDLSRYLGRPIELVLSTDPLADVAFDWSGWGTLRLTPVAEDVGQYVPVYAGEVQVLENRHAFPRAFLVGSVASVPDHHAAIERMKQPGADPHLVAVVEGAPEPLGGAASGSVAIRGYRADAVELDVETRDRSFLVLTDSFLPGWVAQVDGARVPIYPTNLAFRGIYVPAGRHLVQFTYEPRNFRRSVALAGVGGLAILGAVGWPVVGWLRARSRGSRGPQSKVQGPVSE